VIAPPLSISKRSTVTRLLAGRRRLAIAAVTAVLLLAASASARRPQEPAPSRVVPLQVTGDAAARFSLVVLGDGYTAAEIPKFRAQVDKHLNVLWSIEPFRSYRNYINVYAVEIISGDSGITCDPEIRQEKLTPLKMVFGGGCTNPNARGITLDQAAAKTYAAKATPHFDQILVLANTDTYGGIGGSVATTSGGNSLGPLITPHEIGHSLGRLQDEYTYSARGKAGGPYTGAEPTSIHLTLLTEEEMKARQLKWWRWLGEESESGGRIGRFEGGSSRTTGIWRPSKHSMMISVGYYFDQVSRERMTQRISEQVQLIAASTPVDAPVGAADVIWIETAQPMYHELDITWQVDGRPIPAASGHRHLNLGTLGSAKPAAVAVSVVDPTTFVRDPEIRAKALTATRSWTVGPSGASRAAASPASADTFLASTQTERAVGGNDVVYVMTSHPAQRVPEVTWRLNGKVMPPAADNRVFNLARQKLPPGTSTLTASIAGTNASREWTVDNTMPTVKHALSSPVASANTSDGPHYFLRDEFTMQLDAADDQPGYVVAEFRLNGDGWHHYYGWPDAAPGTPYKFTPRGTTIKELVYGSLSSEGLSPQPWEPREPGWGTHRIEYRGIDAAGNIGRARELRVTIQPTPSCTQTISANHTGDLRADAGVLCITGASVSGSVTIGAGASLVATKATVGGAVRASSAARVELIETRAAEVHVTGATGPVILFGSVVTGTTTFADNRFQPVLVGNTVGARPR
jgi:hypothetical protein